MAARVGLFEVLDIGVNLRPDYAVGDNPWTFVEPDPAEPLAKVHDGLGDRRRDRVETALKTASPG
jgi:hypothetical protein